MPFCLCYSNEYEFNSSDCLLLFHLYWAEQIKIHKIFYTLHTCHRTGTHARTQAERYKWKVKTRIRQKIINDIQNTCKKSKKWRKINEKRSSVYSWACAPQQHDNMLTRTTWEFCAAAIQEHLYPLSENGCCGCCIKVV